MLPDFELALRAADEKSTIPKLTHRAFNPIDLSRLLYFFGRALALEKLTNISRDHPVDPDN